MPEEKKAPIARYKKTTETIVPTYAKAVETADALFAPYEDKAAGDDRTAPEAKVRIRRQKDDSGFRVVLSKAMEVKKAAKVAKEEPEKRERKRRPRHRNDTKGKKSRAPRD